MGKKGNAVKETCKYDDIINLPHHVSEKRARMSMTDRAAQFSPFAALTGYDAAIAETARLTEFRMELEESAKAALNEKLRKLAETVSACPEITATYFLPDARKSGGAYVRVKGRVKKVDVYRERIILVEGMGIPFGDIYELEL